MSHHHPPAVSWHEARELLHAAASALSPTLSTEALPLQATIGKYVAEDLTARMPVPHYSSSAMDGYAVAGAPPWRLVSPDYPEDARTNVHHYCWGGNSDSHGRASARGNRGDCA